MEKTFSIRLAILGALLITGCNQDGASLSGLVPDGTYHFVSTSCDGKVVSTAPAGLDFKITVSNPSISSSIVMGDPAQPQCSFTIPISVEYPSASSVKVTSHKYQNCAPSTGACQENCTDSSDAPPETFTFVVSGSNLTLSRPDTADIAGSCQTGQIESNLFTRSN